jgi:protease I
MTRIDEARILVMATDGFEHRELTVPVERLRRAGATVEIAAPAKTMKPGKISAWDGEGPQPNWGAAVAVDRKLREVDVENYDALIIPGGQMNPDKLRMDSTAVGLVRLFTDAGKVVAAICHGPWLLVEAGVVDGRRVTSWPSLRTDLTNAGADWVDERVVVDNGIITSRNPGDLEAFCAKIIEEVEEGRHPRGIGAALADMLGA